MRKMKYSGISWAVALVLLVLPFSLLCQAEGFREKENQVTQDRSELQDRMMAAMLVPIVADAAALGSHWVYDLNELNSRYPQGLKGFEQPVDGHYHAKRKSGETTHYGDASRLLLVSVAENRGVLPSV